MNAERAAGLHAATVGDHNSGMAELDVSKLLTVDEAIAVLDSLPIAARRTMLLPLLAARDLRLAEDLVSDSDYPPFAKSLMDGYAVRCADLESGAAALRVVGEIAAGQVGERPVQAGEAMAIMTGAPLPAGADGVVPIEQTQRAHGEATVRITGASQPGRNIAPRGSDCAAGQVVLRRGQRLGPAQLGVAATIGAAVLPVFEPLRVAVLSTGDELVGFRDTPGPGQIRNANSVMIGALLRRLGCQIRDLGIRRDEPEAIRAALELGMNKHDALFVSGGMSMGAYDYVPRLLLEMGVTLHITKLRIKPGKPFVVGSRGACHVFGLPGNPVSAFVCTLRLASLVLARCGAEAVRIRMAPLAAPLAANGPREFYLPAVLAPDGTSLQPLEWKGSADVFTLAQANALIIRPEIAPPAEAGQSVPYLEIPS